MIAYLDTSSLVKLYIEEYGSEDVRNLVANASAVLTSIVAYAESRAAFAKQHKNRELTQKDYLQTKVIFERDWKETLVIGIDEEISRNAGELAERYLLRGFDAIHLASYVTFTRKIKSEVLFSSFDDRLNKAAAKETS